MEDGREHGPGATPGYWTYALTTGAGAALAVAATAAFSIRGSADVALVVVVLSTISYLVTPAALRSQAPRVFGVAGLAMASLLAGAAIGAMVGAVIAAPLLIGGQEAPAFGAELAVLALAATAAAAGYLAFFHAFFTFVAPRAEEDTEYDAALHG